MENQNTLFKDFIITGTEPNCDLEIVESKEEFLHPLSRSYKPKILFQLYEHSDFHDEALSRLFLPSALRFLTHREISSFHNPFSFHSFVITRDNGNKCWGVSLVYYEFVTDLSICSALHTLQTMFNNEVTPFKKSDRNFENERKPRISSERSRSLPRSSSSQVRRMSSSIDLSEAFYDMYTDKLYVSKSIGLILSSPQISVSRKLLETLYREYVNHSATLEFGLLRNFLFEALLVIPNPSAGLSVQFWCLNSSHTFSSPKEPLELPLFDYKLSEFFSLLGPENALKLLICALLENQILVFSSDAEKLGIVCESLISLLYPFSWPHVYVPLLPPSLENFLDAPVPFLMGLLRVSSSDLSLYRDNLAVLDIESGELQLPEELPDFPFESELIDELTDVIAKYGDKEGNEKQEPFSSSSSSITLEPLSHIKSMIHKFEKLNRANKSNRDRGSSKSNSFYYFNNAIREVLTHRFLVMFEGFENFIIYNDLDESESNFDKISFLSDQRVSHLSFLSSFLETTIFANFISLYEKSEGLPAFDYRLTKMKKEKEIERIGLYNRLGNIAESERAIDVRLRSIEHSISMPSPSFIESQFEDNKVIMTQSLSNSKKLSSSFIKKNNFVKSTNKTISSPETHFLDSDPVETQWKFVQSLLNECKQKTKRILLEKLGSEARNSIEGEENMLVASLIDLIERIWSHGHLIRRSRKSSFWDFLVETLNYKIRSRESFGSLVYLKSFTKSKPYLLPESARRIQVVLLTPEDDVICSLMHNVSTITGLKTDNGRARAWIRLSLEQKKLSTHLRSLLSRPSALANYKAYAFLRSEEEREQSLHYYTTLNTVDFSCFTNAYIQASFLYQVLIIGSQFSLSSHLWIHVIGSLRETTKLIIPPGVTHFSFWSLNLGILSSLRLGLTSSSSSSCLVSHVLIKNEFNGNSFVFHCGRHLGTNVDDGSTERYMVRGNESDLSSFNSSSTYPLPIICPANSIKASNHSQVDILEIQTILCDAINNLVKFTLKSLKGQNEAAQYVCGHLGLVHALIYVFSFGYKSVRLFGKNLFIWDFFLKVTMDFNQSYESGTSVSKMGNGGTLDSVLRKQSLEKTKAHDNLNHNNNNNNNNLTYNISHHKLNVRRNTPTFGTMSKSNQFRKMYTKLITRIETTCHRLGKDDKFQLFVVLAAHDRLLGKIVTDLTRAVAAQHLYDEVSFLRDSSHLTFVSHILKALDEFSIPVDPALKRTLEEHDSF